MGVAGRAAAESRAGWLGGEGSSQRKQLAVLFLQCGMGCAGANVWVCIDPAVAGK